MSAYQLYETLKREWIAKNPSSTPKQYTAAMRRIAMLCGV